MSVVVRPILNIASLLATITDVSQPWGESLFNTILRLQRAVMKRQIEQLKKDCLWFKPLFGIQKIHFFKLKQNGYLQIDFSVLIN